MKTCPFCAEEIQDAAIVCKHCGRELTPSVAPPAAAANAGLLEAQLLVDKSKVKSPGFAAILGFFFPALAAFYTGRLAAAMFFLLLDVINLVLVVVGIGVITGLLFRLVAGFLAYNWARETNQKALERLVARSKRPPALGKTAQTAAPTNSPVKNTATSSQSQVGSVGPPTGRSWQQLLMIVSIVLVVLVGLLWLGGQISTTSPASTSPTPAQATASATPVKPAAPATPVGPTTDESLDGARTRALEVAVRTVGFKCDRATKIFYQGHDTKSAQDFWDIRCADGGDYAVSSGNSSGTNASVIQCSVLKAMTKIDCFKPF